MPSTPQLKSIRIGSRGSPLALWQARHIADRLRAAAPGLEIELEVIRTAAEKFPDAEPQAIGVGIFTKEIDEQLLSGRIDIGVHSLKDVPSAVHADLRLAAVPERETPLDAFVAPGGKGGTALWDLPEGASVGTGSPRRRAQILHRRPDLKVIPLRGNVDTRLRKSREGGLAGTILAQAGLKRLGKEDLIVHPIPTDWLVPAVGQGALAVFARADRADLLELARTLDHPPSRVRITAERAFLARLRGGCQVPAGALAEIEEGGLLWLIGVLATSDGTRCLRGILSGPLDRAEEIGKQLAEDLLERGGEEVLAAVRSEPPAAGISSS